MLDSIRRLLGSEASPPTSEQIADAIETLREDLLTARAHLEEVEAEYPDILLLKDEAAAKEHEGVIETARREVTRLEAAVPRLEERLGKVRGEEREAAIRARVQEASAWSDEGVKIVRGLEKKWAEIVQALEQLREIDHGVDQVLRLCRDELPGDFEEVRAELRSPNAIVRPFNPPLYDEVVLPQIRRGGAFWGTLTLRRPPDPEKYRATPPEPPRGPSLTTVLPDGTRVPGQGAGAVRRLAID